MSWHPGLGSHLFNSSLANVRMIFEFFGTSAHASSFPHLGRSALDAAELMNVGCNFLREHVPSSVRLHYAFLDAGGPENVVQSYSKVIYAIRAPRQDVVKQVMERVKDVARGAALMTGTKVEFKVVSAYSDIVSNSVLDRLMIENASRFFPLEYSNRELEYAQMFSSEGIDGSLDCTLDRQPSASTDFGDVSRCVPSSCMTINCLAAGTGLHSWQATAQGKSSIANRGMHVGALTIASTALDLISDSSLLSDASREFHDKVQNHEYSSLIPAKAVPGAF